MLSGSVHIAPHAGRPSEQTQQREDLEWQLVHEKRISQTMIEMLEKKVSNLLAEINKLETSAEEEHQKRVDFNAEIFKLQDKIKSQHNELTLEKVHNQKLKFDIKELNDGLVTKVEHEKIRSALQLAQSEIRYKNGRLADQKQEIEQLMAIIRQLHQQVTKASVSLSYLKLFRFKWKKTGWSWNLTCLIRS